MPIEQWLRNEVSKVDVLWSLLPVWCHCHIHLWWRLHIVCFLGLFSGITLGSVSVCQCLLSIETEQNKQAVVIYEEVSINRPITIDNKYSSNSIPFYSITPQHQKCKNKNDTNNGYTNIKRSHRNSPYTIRQLSYISGRSHRPIVRVR